MSTTDRSYAVRMKQIAGGINAQFRANNSTAPQENSQPGAVEQSYLTGRIFGQISVNVDGVISPACVCLGTTSGGGQDIERTFDSCADFEVITVNEGDTLTITKDNIVEPTGILNGTTAAIIFFGTPYVTSTPGTYTVGCLIQFNKAGSGSAAASTSYIVQNTSGSPFTFAFDGIGAPAPQIIAGGTAVVITSVAGTTSYTVS